MIRIIIVDDHAVLRNGLSVLFAAEAEMRVVGEAANGQSLLDQLPALEADLVLLDMNMPVLDGVATVHRLRAEHPHLRILVLSMIDQPLRIKQVLDAGALGYIFKNTEHAELLAAVRAVAAGQRFLGTELGLLLLDMVVAADMQLPMVRASVSTSLSRRELEVLQLVAQGLTTHQIAEQLFTSKRTIETHRQNILEKTGARNTAVLVRYALMNGLLTP